MCTPDLQVGLLCLLVTVLGYQPDAPICWLFHLSALPHPLLGLSGSIPRAEGFSQAMLQLF